MFDSIMKFAGTRKLSGALHRHRRMHGIARCALAAMVMIGVMMSQNRTAAAEEAVAILAGGCFWCVESDFDQVPGVLKTISGYSGGKVPNPTYENHSATGHREVVQITYDPAIVSYERLLEIFWRSVDPTDGGGQFCDRGHSYTTAIYATTPDQLAKARASKAALQKSGKLKDQIATSVEEAARFWAAEGYHQDYYKKNPIRYKIYRIGCGRDARVRGLWGDEAHTGTAKHGS